MDYIEMVKKLELIETGVYQICKSLIYIVDMECCSYGQDESIKMAEDYITAYEADHPELNEDNKIFGQAFDPD